ncbi:MAG: 2OG-Fe(II) oxygenase family protein [Rhodobacter sp.]|nr:2OG-Fe(II) oxygenase family protein [Rhodobacter sp.]
MEIPVLDATGLDGGAPAELVSAFRRAYGDVGFAYLINHGIPAGLIDRVFDASRRFHAMPLAAKAAIALDQNHRGYIAIDTSTDVNSKLADVTRPNQSASFMMMADEAPDPARYLSGHNQWPALEGFRAPVEAYNAALTALARRLIDIALASFGADETARAAFDRPTTWLRLLHYPPQPPDSPEDLYGSAPHTDFGCLTLLAQDATGGLQVQTPQGGWIDVPPRPDALVVNTGDMLHRMSNGALCATPHRVINRSGRERFSVPFFYDPDVAFTVAPLPGTGAPRFEPLDFGDFLRAELQAGYDAHKPDRA